MGRSGQPLRKNKSLQSKNVGNKKKNRRVPNEVMLNWGWITSIRAGFKHFKALYRVGNKQNAACCHVKTGKGRTGLETNFLPVQPRPFKLLEVNRTKGATGVYAKGGRNPKSGGKTKKM